MVRPFKQTKMLCMIALLSIFATGCKKKNTNLPPKFSQISAPNAKVWKDNILLAGQVTPSDLKVLKKQKFRSVLNLRTKSEMKWDEKGATEKLGMTYLSLPIPGAKGLTKKNAMAFTKILKDPKNYPILIHCGSGNRVGALFAMRAFYDGKRSLQKALDTGTAAGMRSNLRNHLKTKLRK